LEDQLCINKVFTQLKDSTQRNLTLNSTLNSTHNLTLNLTHTQHNNTNSTQHWPTAPAVGCALRAGTGATVEATALVPNVRERDKPQFLSGILIIFQLFSVFDYFRFCTILYAGLLML